MDAGRNLRVELQANELPLVAGSSGLCERPFDMAPPGKPRRFNPFSLLLPIVGFVLAYLLIPDRLAPWCGVLILLGVLAYAFREGRG